METAVILLTIVAYGVALFLWWWWRTPIFFFTLLGGHIGSLISPLWPLLYSDTYRADLTIFYSIADIDFYRAIVIGSAWYYSLPALVVLALYRLRWWFSGYIMGLATFAAFVFYHFLFELSGINMGLWSYAQTPNLLPGVDHWILSVVMAALISFSLLYLLLLIWRFSLISMLFMLAPALLLLSLVVRGMLGAPLWIAMMFDAQNWAAVVGVLCTIGLLAWGIHIVAWGLARVDREIVV